MRSWTIRERCDTSDDQGIRTLTERCYPTGSVSWERFQHWYFGLGDNSTVVLAEEDGRIVGMQPLQLLPHVVNGEPVLAGVMTGVMVDPHWRRRGMFTDLINESERVAFTGGAKMLWTMPNDRSKLGFEKLGYQFPGERRLFVWSHDPGKLFRQKSRWLPSSVLGVIARIACFRKTVHHHSRSCREVSQLSPEAVRVAAAGAISSTGLVQHRSEEWIKWRFGAGMGRPYRFMEVFDTSTNRVEAWSVITKEKRSNLWVGYVLDFAGTNRRVLGDVVQRSLSELADWGVDLVLCVASGTGVTRLLVGAGFVPVPAVVSPKRFHVAYRTAPAARSSLGGVLESIGSWNLNLADWDTL